MTRTSHGHHIPLSPTDDETDPMPVARCGGPRICRVCSRECSMFSHPSGKECNVPDPTGRIADLAKHLGLNHNTVADLLMKGWVYSETLNEPAKWMSPLAAMTKAG